VDNHVILSTKLPVHSALVIFAKAQPGPLAIGLLRTSDAQPRLYREPVNLPFNSSHGQGKVSIIQ
jgi:hypothetical protein